MVLGFLFWGQLVSVAKIEGAAQMAALVGSKKETTCSYGMTDCHAPSLSLPATRISSLLPISKKYPKVILCHPDFASLPSALFRYSFCVCQGTNSLFGEESRISFVRSINPHQSNHLHATSHLQSRSKHIISSLQTSGIGRTFSEI